MENRINKKRIGENINALAKWYGFKIKDIEEEAGVSQGYLSKLAGKNSNDSNAIVDLLLVSSQKFHVSIDSLVSLDFQKIASPDRMRLHCFLDTLLYLSNRGVIEWKRNLNENVYDRDSVASFVCEYDKDISFYIMQLDNLEEELPGFSFYVSNKDNKPTEIARFNIPGPALYELLRQLFEIASANSEFVSINPDADSAIRKFMAENKLVGDPNEEQKKYKPLFNYLIQSTKDDFILTFEEVEEILGFPLPPNAWSQQAFWSNNNNGQHHHCRAWMDAGYVTINAHKNTIEKIVRFRKIKET